MVVGKKKSLLTRLNPFTAPVKKTNKKAVPAAGANRKASGTAAGGKKTAIAAKKKPALAPFVEEKKKTAGGGGPAPDDGDESSVVVLKSESDDDSTPLAVAEDEVFTVTLPGILSPAAPVRLEYLTELLFIMSHGTLPDSSGAINYVDGSNDTALEKSASVDTVKTASSALDIVVAPDVIAADQHHVTPAAAKDEDKKNDENAAATTSTAAVAAPVADFEDAVEHHEDEKKTEEIEEDSELVKEKKRLAEEAELTRVAYITAATKKVYELCDVGHKKNRVPMICSGKWDVLKPLLEVVHNEVSFVSIES
jgi:hypothetical protein